MQERISSAEVARAFDQFLERSRLIVPNRLHRIVAEYTGLHPTTVLRYHRQELESANPKVLDCLEQLEERLSRGESLGHEDVDEAMGVGGIGVSVHELQRWFDRVIELLEGQGQYLLYRYVAEKLQVHPTTIMRYHRGELSGAPSKIVPTLRDIHRRLASGEIVEFKHGPGEGERVVPRRCFLDLLEEIEKLGLLSDDLRGNGGGFDAAVERTCGMRRGTIMKVRTGLSWPFVKLDLYGKLHQVRERAIYDPCRHYEVGDRLYHHDLGTGTVIEKRHKSRILVDFPARGRRMLREDVWMDPRWPQSHP